MADNTMMELIPKEWFPSLDFGIGAITPSILYAVIIMAAAWLGYRQYKNKKIFKFKVVVYNRRVGRQPKENYAVGGFIKGRDNIQKFKIKFSKWNPRDFVELDKIPDAKYIDENNTVYYERLDPSTFIQVRRIFNERPSKTITIEFIKDYLGYKVGSTIHTNVDSAEEYIRFGYAKIVEGSVVENHINDAYYEPIPTDTKRMVVMGLSNAREALKLDLFKLQALTIGAVVVIALTFLIAYYILNARGAVG